MGKNSVFCTENRENWPFWENRDFSCFQVQNFKNGVFYAKWRELHKMYKNCSKWTKMPKMDQNCPKIRTLKKVEKVR